MHHFPATRLRRHRRGRSFPRPWSIEQQFIDNYGLSTNDEPSKMTREGGLIRTRVQRCDRGPLVSTAAQIRLRIFTPSWLSGESAEAVSCSAQQFNLRDVGSVPRDPHLTLKCLQDHYRPQQVGRCGSQPAAPLMDEQVQVNKPAVI